MNYVISINGLIIASSHCDPPSGNYWRGIFENYSALQDFSRWAQCSIHIGTVVDESNQDVPCPVLDLDRFARSLTFKNCEELMGHSLC